MKLFSLEIGRLSGYYGFAPYQLMDSARRGEYHGPDPIVIEWGGGSRLLDFLWVGTSPIAHRRVFDTFARHGLSGCAEYPVRALDKKKAELVDYRGFAVTGRCARAEVNRNPDALVYTVGKDGCYYPYFRGLAFSLDGYQGEDFFMGPPTAFILVSERGANVIRTEKLKGCELTPAEDVEASAHEFPVLEQAKPEMVITRRL